MARTAPRRSQGPGLALQPSLRAVQESSSRRDAAADLSRNHGARARRHRQDHHRYRRAIEPRRRALSAVDQSATRTCDPTTTADGRQPMRPSLAGAALAIILLIALVVAYSTFFTVYQTKQALVVRLGKPVRVITEPGLNAKIPFIDAVIYIDKRILAIESPAQEVIASSQDKANAGVAQAGERLVVDAFARYRITDPLKFYQTVGPEGANSQLSILLNSALRRVLGAATLADAVRNRREALMLQMRDQLDRDAQPFGIEIVDVRIRR